MTSSGAGGERVTGRISPWPGPVVQYACAFTPLIVGAGAVGRYRAACAADAPPAARWWTWRHPWHRPRRTMSTPEESASGTHGATEFDDPPSDPMELLRSWWQAAKDAEIPGATAVS